MKKINNISWVHPAIEIRSAGEKGSGSFLKESVRKGELLVIQGGRIIHKDLLDEPEQEPYAYHCFQVERDFYICPIELTPESLDGIFEVNHSCEPTTGFQGQLGLVAIRDLAAGEEVTFDYAMTDVGTHEEGWEDMVCLCNTPTCRRIITGTDWKNPDLQKKYAGYFSPYVQRLIDQQT